MSILSFQSTNNTNSFGSLRNTSHHALFCDTTTYIRLSTVLLLRAGYVLVQIGSIPVNDVYSITLHNILDITVTLCSYGLMGYMFSFGTNSLAGFIGSSSTFYNENTNYDEVIYGFSACLLGSSIITTMLSGRLLTMAAAGISFLHTGLLMPLVMHWIWHDRGWMAKQEVLKVRVGVKDYAGGMTVHLTSGITALWATVCLGRRLIKLNDLHVSSLGNASPGTVFIGYTFVIIGLISFGLPSRKYEFDRIPEDFLGIILVNSIMALTAGLFVIIFQCFCFGETSGYWIILKYLQGCLAGLVTISCGTDVYDPTASFIIAGLGALLFYSVTIISERMFHEDYCNIIPVHVFCAFLGTIFPPLLGARENLGSSINWTLRLYHTMWQLVCAVFIVIWTTAFTLPLFAFLHALGLLANKAEELNHQRSLNVLKNIGNRSSFWRIFTLSEITPYVQPGPESKDKDLDKLKEHYDSRREILEAAMAKKEVKSKSEKPIVQLAAIPAEDVVKDMGILEAERYPASYDEVMEKRITDPMFVYPAVTPTVTLKNQPINENAEDSKAFKLEDSRLAKIEVNKKSRVLEKTNGSPKKKSPRRRRVVKRRRRAKRLESTFYLRARKKDLR